MDRGFLPVLGDGYWRSRAAAYSGLVAAAQEIEVVANRDRAHQLAVFVIDLLGERKGVVRDERAFAHPRLSVAESVMDLNLDKQHLDLGVDAAVAGNVFHRLSNAGTGVIGRGTAQPHRQFGATQLDFGDEPDKLGNLDSAVDIPQKVQREVLLGIARVLPGKQAEGDAAARLNEGGR